MCVPIKVCNSVAVDGHGTAAINCAMRCEQDFAPTGTARRHLLEKLWGVTDVVPLRGHHHPYIEGHLHWPHYDMGSDWGKVHGIPVGAGDPNNYNSGGETD